MERKKVGDSVKSWAIAASGFLNSFLVMGSGRGNPIIFVALVDGYGNSRHQAAWPFTLMAASKLVSAPLTGFLSTQFSERIIQTAGILIYVLGCSLCFFSTNIYYIAVFFGFFKGLGASMTGGLMPGLINKTFRRHRATAMGLSSTGMPVAGFVFPYIVQNLLKEYALPGTFLLLGGISLHAVIGVLLLVKPLEEFEDKVIHESVGENTISSNSKQICEENSTEAENTKDGERKKALTEKETISKPSFTGDQVTPIIVKVERLHNQRQVEDAKEISSKIADTPQTELPTRNSNYSSVIEQPIVPNGFDKSLRSKRLKNSTKSSKFDWKIFWSIFKNRGFYLMGWTRFTGMLQQGVFQLVIVDYLKDKGIGFSQAILMLSVSSSGDIIGKLGFGWVTDGGYVTRQLYVSVLVTLTGIMFILITTTKTFGVLMFYVIMMRVFQGSRQPASFVLLSDYLKIEQLHLANSALRMVVGFSTFARIALIGLFRDHFGSYDGLFQTLAALSMTSSIMWFVEYMLLRRKRRSDEISQ